MGAVSAPPGAYIPIQSVVVGVGMPLQVAVRVPPGAILVGLTLRLGPDDDVTVKVTPLLAAPPTVTTTGPVAAPAGTGATMLVALQLVGVAAVPLKVTVLVPCVAPKLKPLIVTDVPIGPEVGERLLMAGAGETATVKALLVANRVKVSEEKSRSS
jgi:hypothetical protein